MPPFKSEKQARAAPISPLTHCHFCWDRAPVLCSVKRTAAAPNTFFLCCADRRCREEYKQRTTEFNLTLLSTDESAAEIVALALQAEQR